MHSPAPLFENREHAGRELASALAQHETEDCIVLAIPRGGVVIGDQVAGRLHFPMDVIVPRKIRAPQQPELAIGAVASWGESGRLLDKQSIAYLHVDEAYLESETADQMAEIDRRLVTYRGTTAPPNLASRTAIVVDDGIATGYTIEAAALALRTLDAGRVIIAVPVAPGDSLRRIEQSVDEVVCLHTPSPFVAVGCWYRDFEQVSDREVLDVLARFGPPDSQ